LRGFDFSMTGRILFSVDLLWPIVISGWEDESGTRPHTGTGRNLQSFNPDGQFLPGDAKGAQNESPTVAVP